MAALLFAHRGGVDGGHPENSLQAFAHALAVGASLETDVRLSLDGVPVLVHDPYVRRGKGWPRRVRRLTARRLAAFGVPTLDEMYRTLGTDFEVSIDVKDPEAAFATIEVAEQHGAVARLWLVHDSIYTLQRIRRRSAEVRLVHETRLPDLQRRTTTPDAHMDALVRSGVDAQNTHWRRWTPALVDAAHHRGLLAFGSIAQTRPHMAEALRKGLDGLYTDRVGDLVAVAREVDAEAAPEPSGEHGPGSDFPEGAVHERSGTAP